MWKNRLMYIILLMGMVVFYVDHSGWVSWFALLLTLWLPVFSLVLSLPSVIGRSAKISAKSTCQRFEENEITFSLKKGEKLFPVFCKFSVRICDLMSCIYREEKIVLSQRSRHKAEISTAHSGAYEYELVKGRAYDFLGLFSFPIRLPKKMTVTVMPSARSPEPCPDFGSFFAKAYRPKPGGGFSELHEMREYQAGDPLRTIHWKLSAKTDKLIIREAQEPEQQVVMVTLNLTDDRTKMDAVLDELMWVSLKLLELEINHTVSVVNSHKPELLSMNVTSEDELNKFLRNIMSTPIATSISGTDRKLPKADWQYHINPNGKEDAHEAQ